MLIKSLIGIKVIFFRILAVVILIFPRKVSAQQPMLPPTNLGLANVFDGVAGKPGFIFQGYTQVFHTRKLTGEKGEDLHAGLKVNSLLVMNQFIYLTPVKVLGGNLGLTLLVPIVQISASNSSGPAPTVNPAVIGDFIEGTAIQWSNKKIFGMPFSHRVEFDLTLPVGNYKEKYNINPSSHTYSFGLYHAFTLVLSDHFSISSRNQINYNHHFIDLKDRAGAFYNGNYAVDFALRPSLRIEAAAYFLTQLSQDSYSGNKGYYHEQYGIGDTRERILGYGPGIAYFTKSGPFFEIKTFFEAFGKNRFEGIRPTLRIAIPLN